MRYSVGTSFKDSLGEKQEWQRTDCSMRLISDSISSGVRSMVS